MLYVSIVSAAKKLYRSTQHIPRAEVEPQPSAYCSTQHIPRTEVEPQPSVSFHCHGIFFPFDDGYQRLPGAWKRNLLRVYATGHAHLQCSLHDVGIGS